MRKNRTSLRTLYASFHETKNVSFVSKRTITRVPRASKSSKNVMKQILLLIKIHLGGVVVFSISNLIINLTAHEVTKDMWEEEEGTKSRRKPLNELFSLLAALLSRNSILFSAKRTIYLMRFLPAFNGLNQFPCASS